MCNIRNIINVIWPPRKYLTEADVYREIQNCALMLQVQKDSEFVTNSCKHWERVKSKSPYEYYKESCPGYIGNVCEREIYAIQDAFKDVLRSRQMPLEGTNWSIGNKNPKDDFNSSTV